MCVSVRTWACFELGQLKVGLTLKDRRKFLRLAAEQDHPAACFNLGIFLSLGMLGFSADRAEGMAWLEKAATLGIADAIDRAKTALYVN